MTSQPEPFTTAAELLADLEHTDIDGSVREQYAVHHPFNGDPVVYACSDGFHCSDCEAFFPGPPHRAQSLCEDCYSDQLFGSAHAQDIAHYADTRI